MVVAPPPEALVGAAAMYSCCRTAVRGDTSEAALAELEEILGQAHMVADAGEYYRGWCNAAAYVAACGLAERLDTKNPQHLPIILAHTDKRAVLARLGLSALVRHVPHQATPLRPFPLEAIGAHRALHDRAVPVPSVSVPHSVPHSATPAAPDTSSDAAPDAAPDSAAPAAPDSAAGMASRPPAEKKIALVFSD